MHPPNVLAAMQQLFDGVVELKLYEDGLRVLPLLRIRKMKGNSTSAKLLQLYVFKKWIGGERLRPIELIG